MALPWWGVAPVMRANARSTSGSKGSIAGTGRPPPGRAEPLRPTSGPPALFLGRVVGRAADRAPSLDLGQGLGQLARDLVEAPGPEHEMARRIRGLDDPDHGFARAHRIARLLAADVSGRLQAGPGGLRVVGDAVRRLPERAPGPIGAKRAGFDARHLDAGRRDLAPERIGQPLDRMLRG